MAEKPNPHVMVWEFVVRQGSESAFEAAYGPNGAWARLFGAGKGYLGTELLRDAANGRRYLTVDRWRRAEDFTRFRQAHAAAYEALDQQCEPWTENETLLGRFVPM